MNVRPAVLDHYIDGVFLPSPETFLKRYPATGAVTMLCGDASADEVDAAVYSARGSNARAFAASPPAQRALALQRMANVMQARAEEGAHAVMSDTGCALEQARSVEVRRAIEHFRFCANAAAQVTDVAAFVGGTADENLHSFTRTAALGVVGVLGPSTLPLYWTSAKVAAALAAGNSVVLKPSEHAPASGHFLAQVAHESGLAKGLFNVVHGLGENAAGHWLARHSAVNGLALVGSPNTLRSIALTQPHERNMRVVAEIGGRNAAIVMADADLRHALSGVFKATFFNAGQCCWSVTDIYVQREIYDAFSRALRAAAQRIQLAPMISGKHRDAVAGYVRAAQDADARVLYGGDVPSYGDARDNGTFFKPTILLGLADRNAVRQRAVFGPVCHITAFDTEEELMSRVNETAWISCSLWSESVSRVHRIAPQLRASTTWVNTWMLRDLRVPNSGSVYGSGASSALEPFSARSTVNIKI
jgi:aminomuconate-semialdehyde/2-hydroxymuconate-6-semialdehyde dehydrogenase